MQTELAAEGYDIRLLAINEIGFSGLSGMSDRGDLPILQDTSAENVWTDWDVTFRDVVILDRDNQKVGVFNLTTDSLSDPDNYAALKALLIASVE